MITGAVEHEWIAWDGKDTFSLSLGKNMRGKVCGLCGNMNGDPLDDLTPKNGGKFHVIVSCILKGMLIFSFMLEYW